MLLNTQTYRPSISVSFLIYASCPITRRRQFNTWSPSRLDGQKFITFLTSLHYAQRVTITEGRKHSASLLQPFPSSFLLKVYHESHPAISDHPHVLALSIFWVKRGETRVALSLLMKKELSAWKGTREGNLYLLSIKQISSLRLALAFVFRLFGRAGHGKKGTRHASNYHKYDEHELRDNEKRNRKSLFYETRTTWKTILALTLSEAFKVCSLHSKMLLMKFDGRQKRFSIR